MHYARARLIEMSDQLGFLRMRELTEGFLKSRLSCEGALKIGGEDASCKPLVFVFFFCVIHHERLRSKILFTGAVFEKTDYCTKVHNLNAHA